MTKTQGRLVRLRTFDWRDGSHTDATWHAAIDDDKAAVHAVMIAAKTNAEDHQAEIIGHLSAADVGALGLTPGQVMRAP